MTEESKPKAEKLIEDLELPEEELTPEKAEGVEGGWTKGGSNPIEPMVVQGG